MAKIVVIDGQGGRLGKLLVEEVKARLPQAELLAIGTNGIAVRQGYTTPDMEEASMIDGCSPIQTYFYIVFPLLRPTMISVAVLEAMWIWNDYLLPTLILDVDKYKTISMLIQFFRGSYGRVEMGPMMACIMLAIIPIIIVYLVGQKHIIKGVVAGAVKG